MKYRNTQIYNVKFIPASVAKAVLAALTLGKQSPRLVDKEVE